MINKFNYNLKTNGYWLLIVEIKNHTKSYRFIYGFFL
ncbi:Uncharacterised protein [uncultured Clostridium sp.]|nr:Uncharacterised protein [uncultured Clostridium sp.]